MAELLKLVCECGAVYWIAEGPVAGALTLWYRLRDDSGWVKCERCAVCGVKLGLKAQARVAERDLFGG